MELLIFVLSFAIIVASTLITLIFYLTIKLPPLPAPPPLSTSPPSTSPPSTPEKIVENAIYDKIGPVALRIKIAFEMLIGAGLVFLIVIKFSHHLAYFMDQTKGTNGTNGNDFLHTFVYNVPTLDMVGLALAYATAIELAYTLFTANLDEALNPVIMGLAAAILFIVSTRTSSFNINSGIELAIASLALAGLFAVRKFLLKL